MFYVSGQSKKGYGMGVLKLTETSSGWKQRAVSGGKHFLDCLNCEYVSNESKDDIKSWLDCELTKIRFHQELPIIPAVMDTEKSTECE